MRAYGAKRTYAGCHTRRQRVGGKIHVRVAVKNRRRVRQLARLTIRCEAVKGGLTC